MINAIGAATTAEAIGIGMEAIVTGLHSSVRSPDGSSGVTAGDGTQLAIDVIVDFAHTLTASRR